MTVSLGTAYRSFGGEVEASNTPTICRLHRFMPSPTLSHSSSFCPSCCLFRSSTASLESIGMPHCPNENFSGLGSKGQGDWAISHVDDSGHQAALSRE